MGSDSPLLEEDCSVVSEHQLRPGYSDRRDRPVQHQRLVGHEDGVLSLLEVKKLGVSSDATHDSERRYIGKVG